ncbi:HAMP domain-containing protein [Arthrobacter sp. CAU 1506]|uniref:HAMP domain-containing protein n=1 Tax=Arthrobacter sp. CAU 1506 TaxID=2560052 RepID=UPI0010AC2D4A|nr:HAMP domain-containing protein [Arthrobacter sp. CAU 1506]TJY67586.1 HAMP domain-containing protein [Arthrobacter sp. CAU 1506]
MPLWFWILLWVALCALALVFIALLGWRIFRQFMRTLREFESAADRLSNGLQAEPPVAEPHQPRPALFADPAVLKEEYALGKEQRREQRRQRRVARREARGQRQSLHDLRLS